jgi:16S rRNA (guanine527-N7)-methyltransferase
MRPPAGDPVAGDPLAGDPVAALLKGAAARLGLALSPAQRDRLAAYAAEVVRWGRRINLTGAGDVETFARVHVCESVSILPLLQIRPGETWADAGSGAGLPGIPLALLTPGTRWLLVEPREKRWAFLVHAVHTLGLEGVTPVRARIADAPVVPASLDGVVSRALGAPALACHAWLRPGGTLALAVGPDRARWPEAADLPLEALAPVEVPGVPKRFLLRFRKVGGAPPAAPGPG